MLSNLFIKLSRYPYWIIAITIVTAGLLLNIIVNRLFTDEYELKLDTSLEPLFHESSGVFDFYREANQEFGNDKIVLVALQPVNGAQFDLQFFLKLNELIGSISQDVPDIKNVYSLTNIPRIRGRCAGESFFHEEMAGSICEDILKNFQAKLDCINHPPAPSTLEEDISAQLRDLETDPDEIVNSTDETVQRGCEDLDYPATARELTIETENKVQAIFKTLKENRLIKRDLLSSDHKTTALVLLFHPHANPASDQTQQILSRLLGQYRSRQLKIAYAGLPRDEYESFRLMQDDITNLLPISLLVIAIILTLSFRSIRGTLVPLLVVFMAQVFCAGLFAIFGSRLNLVTVILPILLCSVGGAYIIHFMSNYFHTAMDPQLNRSEVIEQSIQQITLPITVATFTTLIGFSALMVSPIPAVQEMGFYACLGIFLNYLLTMIFAPSFLRIFPRPQTSVVTQKRSVVDRLVAFWGSHAAENARRVIIIWIFVSVIALLGAIQVYVNSDTSNFSDKSQIKQDKLFIEENLGGMSYLRIVFSAGSDSGPLLSAETIYRIAALTKWLEAEQNRNGFQKGVRFDKAYTPVEFLDLDRQGLDDLSDAEVIDFFNRLADLNIMTFLNKSRDRLSITIRIKVDSTSDFLSFRNRLSQQASLLFPDLNIRYTGSAMLISESADNIAKSQLTSLVLALTLIVIVLSTLFFSIKIGVLALFPNIASILVFFGALGWSQIPIGVTISVIASITLGIGVDDTIHFITHYIQTLKKHMDEKTASRETVLKVGKPIVYTTIMLTCGFSVFVMSDMQSQIMFGMLSAFTLSICLAADINLLPAILVRSKVIPIWDYLSLHYTEDSLQNIEIFKGLTIRESKMITLMAETQRFEPGELIYRENDSARDLFVILEGTVEIYLEQYDHPVIYSLQTLQVGQVFGISAIFPSQHHLSSAIARSSARLLLLSPQNLAGLYQRYPSIAAKLFVNFIRLADKRLGQPHDGQIIRKKYDRGKTRRFYQEVFGTVEAHAMYTPTHSGLDNLNRLLDKAIARHHASEKATPPDYRPTNKPIPHISTTEAATKLNQLLEGILANRTITFSEQISLNSIIIQKQQLSEAEDIRLKRLLMLLESNDIFVDKPHQANFFNHFTKAQKKHMRSVFPIKTVASEVRLFSEGDFGDSMVVVASGILEVRASIDNRLITMDTAVYGDVVDDMILFSHRNTRRYTVTAASDAEVMFVDRLALDHLQKKHPKIYATLIRNLIGLLIYRFRKNSWVFYE